MNIAIFHPILFINNCFIMTHFCLCITYDYVIGMGVPSFEDELKNRLHAQRDLIYATGATILKSNFN